MPVVKPGKVPEPSLWPKCTPSWLSFGVADNDGCQWALDEPLGGTSSMSARTAPTASASSAIASTVVKAVANLVGLHEERPTHRY